MPRSKGRTGRPWRRAAERIRRLHLPCAHPDCGLPIDYTLPWQHPMSFTVDHVEAVANLPHNDPRLRDPANLQPMHRACNSRKGTTTITEGRSTPSSGAW